MDTSTCLAGQEFSSASASNNLDSSDGLVGSTANDGQCSPCAIGKYKSESSPTRCIFCSAGREYVSSTSDCSACIAGRYQGQNNAPSASCTDCTPGKFVSSPAAPSCGDVSQNACPSGSGFDSMSGVLGPSRDVSPGWTGTPYAPDGKVAEYQWAAIDDDAKCVLCQAGRFKARGSGGYPDGVYKCQEMDISTCPSGSGFSRAIGSSNGNNGNNPLLGATSNDGKCDLCAVNTYKIDAGPRPCDACPLYSSSSSPSTSGATSLDSCVCDAGYTPLSLGGNATTCVSCSSNHYKDTLGMQACTVCPIGTQGPQGVSIGGKFLSFCVFDDPILITSVDHGLMDVTITVASPDAHACYRLSALHDDAPLPQCGSLSGGEPSSCLAPSIAYQSGTSLRFENTRRVSVVACRNNQGGPTRSNVVRFFLFIFFSFFSFFSQLTLINSKSSCIIFFFFSSCCVVIFFGLFLKKNLFISDDSGARGD